MDVDGVRVTRVVEHAMPFPVDFFVEATREDAAAETCWCPTSLMTTASS